MPDEKITVEESISTEEWVKRFKDGTEIASEVLLRVTEATEIAVFALRDTIEMLSDTKLAERLKAVLDQERLAASTKQDRNTIDAAIEDFELETGMEYPESGVILFTGPDDPLRKRAS